jgi:hypothetical protein
MAILAELCGADSWEDIHRFAMSQEGWLRTFLSLPGGMLPSYCFSHIRLSGLSF